MLIVKLKPLIYLDSDNDINLFFLQMQKITGGTDIDYWNIGEDSSQMKSLTILEDDPEKLIKLSDTIQGLVDETIYILIKINDIHY